MVCPKIAARTSKNEANNSCVDHEQCICLFCDCDAAAHSDPDQPGERGEAGKARGDITYDIFLASYICIHILCLPHYISAIIVDRAIQYV